MNMLRCTLLLASVMVLVACSRGGGQAIAEASMLNGRWTVTDGNLRASLTLAQRGDTVSGTGTYTLARPGDLGCGGESLAASGNVSLSGQVRAIADSGGKRQLAARFRFIESGWSPPFVGVLATKDSIAGGLMSVDRGQCRLSLVRER